MKSIKVFPIILFIILFASILTFAQDMNPDAAKLYNEGNSLLKAGNYKGAITNYDQALAIEKDYRIYYQKGIAQKKTNDLSGALSSFEECIKLKSDFEAGYNALGGVYFSMGDYNKAIDNFEKVLSLSTNASVHMQLPDSFALFSLHLR